MYIYIYSILLALIGIIQYTPWFAFGYGAFLLLVLGILIYLIFFKKQIFISSKLYPHIIFLFVWLVVLAGSAIKYGNDSVNVFNSIIVILVFGVYILALSNVQSKTMEKVFEIFLKIGFFVGIGFFILNYFTGLKLLNENGISILVFAFLVFTILNKKHNIMFKIIIFILGALFLYITNGRTVLITFICLPFLFWLSKYRALSITFFFGLIFLSFTLPLFAQDFLLKYNLVLSSRSLLWIEYMNDYVINREYFLIGSNQSVFINAISTAEGWNMLSAHNTYIHTLWSEGAIKFLFIIIPFILLSLTKSNVKETRVYRTLLLSIFLIQVFEVIEISGVSYFSIVYAISLFLILVIKPEKE